MIPLCPMESDWRRCGGGGVPQPSFILAPIPDGVALSCRPKRAPKPGLTLVIWGRFHATVALMSAQRSSLQMAPNGTMIQALMFLDFSGLLFLFVYHFES